MFLTRQLRLSGFFADFSLNISALLGENIQQKLEKSENSLYNY